jgi:hypothetical protein
MVPNIRDSLSLVLPVKGYVPEKICLVFAEKGGGHHLTLQEPEKNHTIRFSVSEIPTVEDSSSYVQKCGIFNFCQQKDNGCVFMRLFRFDYFFSRVDLL